MSKGKSEIEVLKKPFNGLIKQHLPKFNFDVVRTSRKKKGSEEIVNTVFGAVRFPVKRSEVADTLECEVKNVNSLAQSASKFLSRDKLQKIANAAGWSDSMKTKVAGQLESEIKTYLDDVNEGEEEKLTVENLTTDEFLEMVVDILDKDIRFDFEHDERGRSSEDWLDF